MVTPKSSQSVFTEVPKVSMAFAFTPEPCVVVNNSSVTKFIAGVFTFGKLPNLLLQIFL